MQQSSDEAYSEALELREATRARDMAALGPAICRVRLEASKLFLTKNMFILGHEVLARATRRMEVQRWIELLGPERAACLRHVQGALVVRTIGPDFEDCPVTREVVPFTLSLNARADAFTFCCAIKLDAEAREIVEGIIRCKVRRAVIVDGRVLVKAATALEDFGGHGCLLRVKSKGVEFTTAKVVIGEDGKIRAVRRKMGTGGFEVVKVDL